jgi:predicted AAA+ superfamily ATPase
MERQIIEKLRQWKIKRNRKPLILQGARQVGKTWILKYFGKVEFEDVAYFNFDEQEGLKEFFKTTKNPQRIIQKLSSIHGRKIIPQTTLIIFDEIQECNEALNSLKYFCEDAPEYSIVSAGSLLGVSLSRGCSFPVGKVEFLSIYPLSFTEFLKSADSQLFDYLNTITISEKIPDIFFNRLVEYFKIYFISGGMPEAALEIIETNDLDSVQSVLKNILHSYQLDFSKHIDKKDIPKIDYVWKSIDSQLAMENKKFLYQAAKEGARAREYENALEWLVKAGLAYRIFLTTKPALPLSAYSDLSSFKLYCLDVGILRRLSNLSPTALSEKNRLFTEFRGALTENYILQSLIPQFDNVVPFYWKSGNQAEIDFLIQYQNFVVPIEVKSGEHTRSRSLSVYQNKYLPEIRIRYSLQNIERNGNLLNIPLFLADYTQKFIAEFL